MDNHKIAMILRQSNFVHIDSKHGEFVQVLNDSQKQYNK